jgi:hypothetical protein
MKVVLVGMAALLLSLQLAGCAKKEAAADIAADAGKGGGAQLKADDTMVKAGLDEVSNKVKAKDYEAAVSALGMIGNMPLDPKQEAAFMKTMRETDAMLWERVRQGDQRAAASQAMLGHLMTGR